MTTNNSDIELIMKEIVRFTEDRDWDQFHNGKDLALALSIEASEVKEELADIMNYAFLIAHKYDMDIKEIILNKLKRNGEKYPVNKAKGSAKKYNEL